MGLYTGLVANLLFPLQEALKKHNTLVIRRAMDESQWWSPEKLEQYRLERLRSLLLKAKKNVPYYRDCFSRLDFNPQNVSSLADLDKLPLLTKTIIRTEGDRMKSEVAKGLARFNTGGSSGEPLIFFIGTERVSHDVAAKWRATRWWGVDIGDPEIVVWGSPIELSAQDRLRQWRDRLMRTQLLPAFQMSEAKLDEFIATIARTRPRMLFGYPSSISLLARHAQKRGQSMTSLGIKVAFVTSERLYEEQRTVISRVFGCRVANGYGGRDAGFIAHECPAGGMHLTAEDIIVEIVDRDGHVLGPGQVGEIVVTHLATSDFPFIRYQTGDMGALSARLCGCGRGLPILEEIQGRTTDFVVAADGTVMHGLALIYPIRDLPGVAAFKVIQHSLNRTEVQIVANGDYSPAVANSIQS
ncbi:MAG: phenylacetate--CoA ligase family protein, partial [Dechloromonas sp.]|nr:phenylacetate--CoA ligase family protein [Dechloromonas sp.]